MKPRIAIIGTGISGLVSAWLLARRHDVTVFEAADYIGGHTNTVQVNIGNDRHQVDTGFIVFNHKTYPHFSRLLEQLRVMSMETGMSFSVRCQRSGLEYNGTSLNTLFAQRSNLVDPGFLGMVRDILRFNRKAPGQAVRQPDASVGEFVAAHRYGQRFRDQYLVPMGAAIWSCPPKTFMRFPIGFVMEFFGNHGMLQVQGRPVWRVVRGGSARYVEALTAPFADRIRLRTPVRGIRRQSHGVEVRTSEGAQVFDEVVVACHADQALAMLDDPTPTETRFLNAFPYQENVAVLHTDTRVLPQRRRAWAAWNYLIPATPSHDVMVTYNMNALQRLDTSRVFCVSLNPNGAIAEGSVLRRMTYHHPVFTASARATQREHASLIRRNRTSFCGAYWGYGFHEDGVNSALAVGRAFGEELVA
jgi:predicted NAD/FAD-binding protein